MENLKIIIVDDNKPFRDGLCFYLEEILGHRVISEAENGVEFLQLSNLNNADIILMDISMPKLNGIEAAKKLLYDYPHKIIALTSFQERTYLNELIEAGIKGCVFKKDIHNELKTAIERVWKDGIYYPENINIIR